MNMNKSIIFNRSVIQLAMVITMVVFMLLKINNQSYAQQCAEDERFWTQSWTSCVKTLNPIQAYGTTHWILFDFDQAESISSIQIWNANRTGQSDRGLKDVIIDYSLDGNTWINLGNHVFPKGTESPTYPGFAGPNLGGQFVKKILITILSTYGDGICASLAEIKFDIDPTSCYGILDECGICDGPGKTTWYRDVDGDGLGNIAVKRVECVAPPGFVDNHLDDCDNGILDWGDIGSIFSDRLCTDCHGSNGSGGFDLTSYDSFSQGGNKCGSSILTGSTLVDIITISQYSGCGPQIGLPAMNDRVNGDPISMAELILIQDWVNDGALEDCRCPNGAPDMDNDGICDAIDYCPGFNNALIGTACDDGLDCTSNDVIDANCNCNGVPLIDSDLDGVCDLLDLAIFDPCTADGIIDGIEPSGWSQSAANDCDNDGVSFSAGDVNDYNECINEIGALAIAACQCPSNLQQAGGQYITSQGISFPQSGSGIPNGVYSGGITFSDRYFLEFPYLKANEEICFTVGFDFLDNRITFDINGVAYTFTNELQDNTRIGQEFCIKTLVDGPQTVMIREEGTGSVFLDGSTYNYCSCSPQDPKYNSVDCKCSTNKTTGTGHGATAVRVANFGNANGIADGLSSNPLFQVGDEITIQYPYIEAGGEICISIGFNNIYGEATFTLNGVPYSIYNKIADTGFTIQEFCIPVTNSGTQSVSITEPGSGAIIVDGSRTAYCNPCQVGDPDSDSDGICDANDPCPNSYSDDSDNDGVCDNIDICLGFNDNFDDDNDGIPNGCDQCPGFSDMIDSDGDTVIDGCDICPGGNDYVDSDMDNIPDHCDDYPCLNFITELTFPNIMIDRKVNYNIMTNGDVSPNNSISYTAGQSVDLKQEFEAKLGSIFEVNISGCQ